MSKSIKSNNQSGGITANNVNIENQYKLEIIHYTNMKLFDYILGRKEEIKPRENRVPEKPSSLTEEKESSPPAEIPEPKIEGPFMTLEARITNPFGIHARPSALLTKNAYLYPGIVQIEKLEPLPNEELRHPANCREMMDIMALEMALDSRVKLYIEICKDKRTKKPKLDEARDFCRVFYALVTSKFDEVYRKQ